MTLCKIERITSLQPPGKKEIHSSWDCRKMSGFTFRQARNIRPITLHHALFSSCGSSLWLNLSRQGVFPRDIFLRPNKLHRTAHCSITFAFSGLILAGAPFKIVGITDVIATVGTAENIHQKHFIYTSVCRKTNGYLADFFLLFILHLLKDYPLLITLNYIN